MVINKDVWEVKDTVQCSHTFILWTYISTLYIRANNYFFVIESFSNKSLCRSARIQTHRLSGMVIDWLTQQKIKWMKWALVDLRKVKALTWKQYFQYVIYELPPLLFYTQIYVHYLAGLLSLYLLSGDAHVIPHIRENSGFNEEPFQAQSFAATLQLGSFADATLDKLQHTILLFPTDLWRRRTERMREARAGEKEGH